MPELPAAQEVRVEVERKVGQLEVVGCGTEDLESGVGVPPLAVPQREEYSRSHGDKEEDDYGRKKHDEATLFTVAATTATAVGTFPLRRRCRRRSHLGGRVQQVAGAELVGGGAEAATTQWQLAEAPDYESVEDAEYQRRSDVNQRLRRPQVHLPQHRARHRHVLLEAEVSALFLIGRILKLGNTHTRTNPMKRLLRKWNAFYLWSWHFEMNKSVNMPQDT